MSETGALRHRTYPGDSPRL